MFKIGDVVQLKSGGSPMTVNKKAGDDGRVECVWFDASIKGQLHRELFCAVDLHVVSEPTLASE